MKDLSMSYLLDFYGDVLTDKQRDMMQQYFNMDLSLSEIADNFNITRQGVRDAIKRGEIVLLELEEKVGFAQKYRDIIDNIEQIRALAQNISFFNTAYTRGNDDIAKSALKIMKICDDLSEL